MFDFYPSRLKTWHFSVALVTCLRRFPAPGYVDTDATKTDIHVSLKISHGTYYAISKHTKYHIVYFLHLTGVPAFSIGWVHSRQRNVYNAVNATNVFSFGAQMNQALLYSLEHARRLVSVFPRPCSWNHNATQETTPGVVTRGLRVIYSNNSVHEKSRKIGGKK